MDYPSLTIKTRENTNKIEIDESQMVDLEEDNGRFLSRGSSVAWISDNGSSEISGKAICLSASHSWTFGYIDGNLYAVPLKKESK